MFGKNRDKGIRLNGLDLEVVQLGNGIAERDLLIHDAEYRNPAYAFLLAKMEELPGFPTPIGIYRSWDNISRYEDNVADQVTRSHRQARPRRPHQAPAFRRHLGSSLALRPQALASTQVASARQLTH